MSETRQLLIDIHSDLGILDFGALDSWELAPVGILVRGCRGLWVDPLALENVAGADRNGLPWGIWNVLAHGPSVKEQVKLWLQGPASPYISHIVDFERWSDGSIPTASQLLEAFERLEDASGKACIGYSRKNLIDQNLATMTTDDLNARYWWLAQYLLFQTKEHPGPPARPSRLREDRVILHQTTDRMPGPPGFRVPNHGQALDRDRWCGRMTVGTFFTSAPPPLSIEARVTKLEQWRNSLVT